ncbi:MAG: Nif11-like leader peptide family natural product precursor [Rivularia sp. (in: cyanobacteria)]
MANITLNQPKTTETVEVFVAKIIQNPKLKEQFKTVTSPKEAANKVVEMAEKHDLFFTKVQVLEWFDSEQIRVSNMAAELGENELEETAGRMVVACNTTTRCGMCSLLWWNEFAVAQ